MVNGKEDDQVEVSTKEEEKEAAAEDIGLNLEKAQTRRTRAKRLLDVMEAS